MGAVEYNVVLPKNINKIIDSLGLKQGIVAERSGYSPKTFSDMLNGRRIIKALDIIRISDALGVTPNEIFGIGCEQRSA